ncbi:deformed epidermal autoregulatory factor 1 homolog [Oratosquilla oratoria]|uniref:deformed epidermal autoregulatory factor 1 homolog n=1 Tax=Oratosquilla oratoria TaxID=337810 RepID=UPI003F75BF6C
METKAHSNPHTGDIISITGRASSSQVARNALATISSTSSPNHQVSTSHHPHPHNPIKTTIIARALARDTKNGIITINSGSTMANINTNSVIANINANSTVATINTNNPSSTIKPSIVASTLVTSNMISSSDSSNNNNNNGNDSSRNSRNSRCTISCVAASSTTAPSGAENLEDLGNSTPHAARLVVWDGICRRGSGEGEVDDSEVGGDDDGVNHDNGSCGNSSRIVGFGAGGRGRGGGAVVIGSSSFEDGCKPSITSTGSNNSGSNSSSTQDPGWREAAKQPILMVRCKNITAELHKNNFGSGSRGKCIRLGKLWFTPTEFEAHCGRSASKDWKRSIRFRGQSLLTLVDEGFLQVHATSCSCAACLDDQAAAGPVRLCQPFKRKRRTLTHISIDSAVKGLKRNVSTDQTTPSTPNTPTVTLPMSTLGQLSLTVPGLVLGANSTTSTNPAEHQVQQAAQQSQQTAQHLTSAGVSGGLALETPSTLQHLSLEKAWEKMAEVLTGLEQGLAGARTLLEELRERTHRETLQLQRNLLQEKEEAVNQAKLEAQLKLSESLVLQVRGDDQSVQPILLDSLISSVPQLRNVTNLSHAKKKCVNCNRESDLECAGCRGRTYCGDFCQRKDWANHQAECGRTSPDDETLSSVAPGPGYMFILSD